MTDGFKFSLITALTAKAKPENTIEIVVDNAAPSAPKYGINKKFK